jgi:hypothetical protein
MTFMNFARLVDKAAPLLFLGLGAAITAAAVTSFGG